MSSPSHWVENLPLVLLGLRCALKSDSTVSPAQMVYGTQLRLPADLFTLPSSTADALSPVVFIAQFQQAMRDLCPIPTRAPSERPVYIPADLGTASQVFVRNDTNRKPLALQRPYDGPYVVLKRSDKYFELEINGKPHVVSIDRLKPAYFAD